VVDEAVVCYKMSTLLGRIGRKVGGKGKGKWKIRLMEKGDEVMGRLGKLLFGQPKVATWLRGV
jgi:hypothetical protein